MKLEIFNASFCEDIISSWVNLSSFLLLSVLSVAKIIDGINYVAYADDTNIYIAKYKIENNQIKLEPIDEKKLNTIKEAMNIE